MGAAVVLAVLAAASAGSARVTGESSIAVSGRVVSISADGTRVAIHLVRPNGKRACHSVAAWSASATAIVPIRGSRTCVAPDSLNQPVSSLTIAGTRVAWVDDAFDEVEGPDGPRDVNFCSVSAASFEAPSAVEVPHCSGSNPDEFVTVIGDGGLIVAEASFEDDILAQQPNPGIFRLAGGRLAKVFPDAYSLLDTEGGRLLMLRGDDVLLATPAGTNLRRIRTGLTVSRDSALLQGNRIVLRAGKRLDVYSTSAGPALESRPLPAKATLRGLALGVVAYTLGSQIRLLRLSDGRDRVFRAAPGLADAELEPEGLAYAYNRSGQGRVAFVPFATLARRLG
jgi:hypothetical protein